jgi:hypothetical protein
MSCQGTVFKAPRARALSGLMAYERMPCGEPKPMHRSERDPRVGLTRGQPWSVLSDVLTLGQNMTSCTGPAALSGQVQDGVLA